MQPEVGSLAPRPKLSGGLTATTCHNVRKALSLLCSPEAEPPAEPMEAAPVEAIPLSILRRNGVRCVQVEEQNRTPPGRVVSTLFK